MPPKSGFSGGGKTSFTSSGGGGSESGQISFEMVASMITQSEEKLTAQLSVIETRIESKLSGIATTKTIWAAVGSAVAAILGIGLTVLALAGDRFDGGISFGRSVGDDLLKNRLAIEENQKSVSSLNGKIDKILEVIAVKSTSGQSPQ